MRILITGGAGFVGSHLADSLVTAGHDVTVVDNLTTGSLENLPVDARFTKLDIRAPLDGLFKSVTPEVVFHLAAQVSVPDSVLIPDEDLSVNIAGTVNVLEAAARAGARKLISISSAAVYGNPERFPITEEHKTEPVSPYGLSKLTGEKYVRLLSPFRGIDYTIVRPSNIYGPRQKSEGEGAVIPAFLHRFLSGNDPVIHGDGAQTRDFIFVGDMVNALVQAMSHADGMTLNVSTGSPVSVRDLWNLTAKIVGWNRDPVFGPERPGDIPHSTMSSELAQMSLEWTPAVTFPTGLAQTVTWGRLQQAASSSENDVNRPER